MGPQDQSFHPDWTQSSRHMLACLAASLMCLAMLRTLQASVEFCASVRGAGSSVTKVGNPPRCADNTAPTAKLHVGEAWCGCQHRLLSITTDFDPVLSWDAVIQNGNQEQEEDSDES